MPGRNILKEDVAETYYHIYARGVNKQKIFLDDNDFVYFLSLLKRYLSLKETKTARGADYPKLHGDIQLLAYCLMSNHFHLLVYQVSEKTMTRLMRGVMTAYSLHFNTKYHRTGHLFESSYRASRVSNEQYLLHISRYIHLNPADWQHYRYSSLSSYMGAVERDWVVVEKIMSLYESEAKYLEFLEDYERQHEDLESIKHELADSI
jgi:REP element-mobilizing transposase RayT